MLIGKGDLNYEIGAGRKAWVHVIKGNATVNDQALGAGDAAAITGETVSGDCR